MNYRAWIRIFLVLLLQISGFALFARGFFPKKIVQPGHASYFHKDVPKPVFDKLVVMVVDAMRADFTFSEKSSMTFVHQLINNGLAIPFTAHSTPPTVTLPRIKGLTTGSTPNFLDAILNIAEEDTSSTLADQDSWLRQMKLQDKTIHMFGDDTWIKLFPGLFDKTDGTASFFVADFTEVDNNVTRHVDDEMSNQEWDVLILHYLGLDHIGHKGGPDSPFMPKKQQEMDGIVRRVFDKIDDKTLFVVAGDHGMNEAGNHGGSSAGETSASMTFISPGLKRLELGYNAPLETTEDYNYYRRIQQADLVPTLSMLFGFPIPKNSLGVMLQEFLPLWNSKDQKRLMEENVAHMMSILESSGDPLRPSTSTSADQDAAFEFLRAAQESLSRASSNYNTDDMVRGVALLALAAAVSFVSMWLLKDTRPLVKVVMTIITSVYLFTMFGSSLIEEEHHFWYWGATGWISWCYLISARKRFRYGVTWIICLAVVRIIRGWNQTGQKYAGGPDIAKVLELPESSGWLWLFIVLYYGQLTERLWRGCFADINAMAGFVFSFTTVVASFVFKLNMAVQADEPVPDLILSIISPQEDPEQIISLARLSFATIGVGALYMLSRLIPGTSSRDTQPLTHLSYILEVLLVNQTRTRNIPIFLLFYFLRYYVRESSKDVASTTVFLLLLQHVSFFALGNSNSLASIDLSNAYNGVGSYNIEIVGVLTFISNWVGPLYWSMAGSSILLESRQLSSIDRENILITRGTFLQLFFSVGTAGVMGACLVLKHHLFIWTVFSPKLLYSAAWTVLQHGLIDILFTSLVLSVL